LNCPSETLTNMLGNNKLTWMYFKRVRNRSMTNYEYLFIHLFIISAIYYYVPKCIIVLTKHRYIIYNTHTTKRNWPEATNSSMCDSGSLTAISTSSHWSPGCSFTGTCSQKNGDTHLHWTNANKTVCLYLFMPYK